MSADPSEVLPLCPVEPQMSERELAALMDRGRVESRIAAKLRLLEGLRYVPDSNCGAQRDSLSREIGELTPLLDLPDDELVVAATAVRTPKHPIPARLAPPVLLHKVLPVSEEVDDAPFSDIEPDIPTQILGIRTTLLELVRHASALPEEDRWGILDALNDTCDEVYGAITDLDDSELPQEVTDSVPAVQEMLDVEASEKVESLLEPVANSSESLSASTSEQAAPTVLVTPEEVPSGERLSPLLPPDFREKILAIANINPTFYIKDVVREIWGVDSLDNLTFAAQYGELRAMISEGILQPRGPKGFSLPEEQRQQVVTKLKGQSVDVLEQRLREAGIPPSPTTRPRRRGNK